MKRRLVVDRVRAEYSAFARHHGLPLPGRGVELTIEDARAGGGYGDIHPVAEIGGRPPGRPILAKVFKSSALADVGGADAVVRGVSGLHRALQRRGDMSWADALLALPYAVVAGLLDGREELVTLMLDLKALGYEPAPLTPELGLADYARRDDDDRIDLALRYAERAALLEEIGFLHGDQNPENLLFSTAALDVQIIDLDTGVVLADGSERPLTPGKLDDCMPPEVKGTGNLDAAAMARYTAAAERWSIGSIVGMIVFIRHPAFFLRAIASPTLEQYAATGKRWPEVDPDGPLFGDPRNRAGYAAFTKALRTLPDGIVDLFGDFFAAGADGSRRPRARDWANAIAATRTPPEFQFVNVDRDVVPEAGEVVVSWAASGADQVESRELGPLAPSGSARTVVDRSMAFTLTAVNRYGATQATSPAVRVVALPRLHRIPVARGPQLALRAAVSVSSPPPTMPRLAPLRVSAAVPMPPALPIPVSRVPIPSPLSFAAFTRSLPASLGEADGGAER